MNTIQLQDLNLLDVGHTIQLYGALYSGGGKMYFVPLPDESVWDLEGDTELTKLVMDTGEWEKFLRQTDVLDIQGPGKAILRKSQRQIDQAIAWRVYERDGYRCRYCGQKRPLTVDHVILWEEGGVSTEDNLISACRRCNKLRGNMQYEDWIVSTEYRRVSDKLDPKWTIANHEMKNRLTELRMMSVRKQRSR